jgi:uncharacterized membrane protein YfcA
MADIAAYLAIGAATGFFAGLLGIGGGTILVSSLALMFGAQGIPPAYVMHMAVGTSLASIVAGAWASFRTHHRHGAVDWAVVRAMVPGVLLGAFAGAGASRWLSTGFLKAFFLVFLVVVTAQMLFGFKPKAGRGLPGRAGLAGTGLFIGASSSLFGGGAAAVGVPFLTWCGLTMHNAIGTVAAVGFPLAIAACLGYVIAGMGIAGLPSWSAGFVYLPALVAISASSLLVAPFGARLAHRLRGPTLRRIFAVFLLAIGAKVAVSV